MTVLAALAIRAQAEVTDLVVTESSADAVLSWSTGTPPWRVLRSETPNFFHGNRIIASGLGSATFVDPGALEHGRPTYFYQVLEDGQDDPPGFAVNPPHPVPRITALIPNSGAPGDTIAINGENFEPAGVGMHVSLGGFLVEVLSFGETELQIEIPEGATTGDIQVCRGVACSNRLRFTVVVGPVFQDLSSIAFETGSGSLWTAERASVDTVFEIDTAGVVEARGALNQAILSHPSPADGSPRIYFCNSLFSNFNQGTIEYVDSGTNTEHFFDAAGQNAGSTSAVRCEALAANDSEPDVVYFIDGLGGTVRRIVRNAFAHDLSYGNQPFSFNSPAGARFDSAGNLYLTATTAIYRIAPGESAVTLIADGFAAASGMDLLEDTGIVTLLVADESTGQVWLVNGETGDKTLVDSGFAAPVGVAFSEDPATGDLYYDVAEPTRIIRLPDPRVEFVEKQDVRVLLSKHGTFDSYPSPSQIEDGKIPVQVKVIDTVDPAGRTVYFRLVDPKDPSPYLSGQKGDNLPSSPAGTITPSAVVDANGLATATLAVDPQYAGNNYRVEASLKPPPGFKKAARSKTYTSWRRVYIEHDRMYKEGEFLTQTSGAGQPNPARGFVANSAIFSVGDTVHVLSGDSGDTSEGEMGTVAAVGAGYVDLASPLTLSYSEPFSGPNPLPYSFLAKVAGGAFDAQPSSADLASIFDDAFTEWVIVSNSGFVPFWPDMSGDKDFLGSRSWPFFKHYDRTAGEPFTNHVQLVSGGRYEASPPSVGDSLGLASHENTNVTADNWSWVFSDTIQALAPANVQNVQRQVIAHELAHQFNVNPGNPLGDGHDGETALGVSGTCPSGGSGPDCCLMNPSTPLGTTMTPRLHANPSAPSEDLLCVRSHVDDLNLDACP